MVTPYLWGPSVGVDVSVNDTQIASTTVPVSDLIDDIDIAGMIHFDLTLSGPMIGFTFGF